MSKYKNISFVLNVFPAISETFIVNQIVAAIKAGFLVNIFAKKLFETQGSSQESLVDQYALLNKCIEMSNVSSKRITNVNIALRLLLKHKRKALFSLLKSFKYCKYGVNGFGLYPFIRSASFLIDNSDMYHAQFGPNGNILIEAKQLKLIKGKVITTFHGYDASNQFLPFDKLRVYYADLFKVGDIFTVNTPFLADLVLELGCPVDKLRIIPMGVDTGYFTYKQKEAHRNNNVKLISVGRLVKVKSFDLGVKAVQKLVINGYDIQYTIIGEGDQGEYLKSLVKRLGIEMHVNFTGALSQEEIKKYMQESDIFLMTSTYDENMRRETQGVVTAEAQACGLPVCAFRSGGVPYTLKDGETGFLSKERNIEEYTKSIKILIDNFSLRKKMSFAARKFIEENYSLESTSKKFIDLYDSV